MGAQKKTVSGLVAAIPFAVLAVLLFAWWPKAAPKPPPHRLPVPAPVVRQAEKPTYASPARELVVDPNEWTYLDGKPGWTVCLSDHDGIEFEWISSNGGDWTPEQPRSMRRMRFKTTTGQPKTVLYNYDTSKLCDTPTPLN